MNLALVAVLVATASAQLPRFAPLSVPQAQAQSPGFTFQISRLNNTMAQIESTCDVGPPKITLSDGKTVSKSSFAHKFEIGSHNITASCGIRTETKKFVSAGDSWPAAGLKSGLLNVKVEKGGTASAQFTVIGSCEPFELSWGDSSEPLVFEGIEASSASATCLTDVTTKKAKHTYAANGEYQLTLKAGNKTTKAKAKITNAK